MEDGAENWERYQNLESGDGGNERVGDNKNSSQQFADGLSVVLCLMRWWIYPNPFLCLTYIRVLKLLYNDAKGSMFNGEGRKVRYYR
mgnify:CR=1 FL=1